MKEKRPYQYYHFDCQNLISVYMFYYKHINKPRPDLFTDTWSVCVSNAVNGYQIQRLFIFLRIRKSSCKMLINKTFKIIESVWKVEKEEKYLMKYFFLDSCVFNRNSNKTSKKILFYISLKYVFFARAIFQGYIKYTMLDISKVFVLNMVHLWLELFNRKYKILRQHLRSHGAFD